MLSFDCMIIFCSWLLFWYLTEYCSVQSVAQWVSEMGAYAHEWLHGHWYNTGGRVEEGMMYHMHCTQSLADLQVYELIIVRHNCQLHLHCKSSRFLRRPPADVTMARWSVHKECMLSCIAHTVCHVAYLGVGYAKFCSHYNRYQPSRISHLCNYEIACLF